MVCLSTSIPEFLQVAVHAVRGHGFASSHLQHIAYNTQTESGNIMERKGSRQSALTDMNSATSDTGNVASPPASRSAGLSLCSWLWLGSGAGIQIPRD